MIRLLLAATLLAGPALADTAPGDLIGTWSTDLVPQPSPDGAQSAWLRQSIAFDAERESYTAEAFADEAAARPIFTYRSEGPWQAAGPAPGVPGALALDLRNERSEVTIHVDAPEIWRAIGLADCPLAIGEAVDIASCVAGPPFQVADCTDLDLAQVEGNALRMGAPGTDRCLARPDALGDLVFRRQP